MGMSVFMAVVLTWAMLFVVPIAVYGAFSAVTGLKPPGDSPILFLAGTAISKTGTALAFVAIFWLGRDVLGDQLTFYVGAWWLMFVIGEVGQAVTPSYSFQEALAGIVSETVYFPASGLIVLWLLKG